MKLTLKNPKAHPQDFYFNISPRTDTTAIHSDFISLSYEEADMIYMYHEMIDHLVRKHGFKYTPSYYWGGSCPTYVREGEEYLYRAHNHFVEVVDGKPFVYQCKASLVFIDNAEEGDQESDAPYAIRLDFYNQDYQLITNDILTRDVALMRLAVMNDVDKVKGVETAQNLISNWFAESLNHLDGLVTMSDSWGYGSHRLTAFPDEMAFSSKLLEDVIAPKYMFDDLPIEHPIEKAVMFATNGDVGPDAMLFYMFLYGGELISGGISVSDYLTEQHNAYDGLAGIYSETHTLTDWADMYGAELWCELTGHDINKYKS